MAMSISPRVFGPSRASLFTPWNWPPARSFGVIINEQKHEGEVQYSGGGVKGLSREIRTAKTTLKLDERHEGVDGPIHSMAVADDTLFVATCDDRILCFRETSNPTPKSPIVWKRQTTRLATPDDAIATATAILEQASSRHGIAIVAGLSGGSLTKALIELSKYHVAVFDDSHDRIQHIRSDLEDAGWYGNRAVVIHGDLRTLELPPYIATTLVSERSDVELTPLLQTLRPYGGIAAGNRVDKNTLKTMKPGSFSLKAEQISGLSLLRRVGPLPGYQEAKDTQN